MCAVQRSLNEKRETIWLRETYIWNFGAFRLGVILGLRCACLSPFCPRCRYLLSIWWSSGLLRLHRRHPSHSTEFVNTPWKHIMKKNDNFWIAFNGSNESIYIEKMLIKMTSSLIELLDSTVKQFYNWTVLLLCQDIEYVMKSDTTLQNCMIRPISDRKTMMLEN